MIVYLIIFISLFFLAFIYLKVGDYFNIIDKPNQRSSHKEATIRGGGIIFYLAIVLFYIGSNFQYIPFFLAVTLIAFVSFIDDLIMLSPKVRLIAHFSTAFLLIWQLGLLTSPIWLLILVSVIIVGFFNLYNFMDGINGMTGIYSIIVLSGFLFVNLMEKILDNNLMIFVLLALLVFGFFNFRKKAAWFAGDIGSMSLATLIFFLGAKFIITLNAPIFILIIVVYGIDACLTIFLRIYRKENISEAHRHHLYQKLVDKKKWSHIKVALVYALIQLLINIMIYYTYNHSFNLQVVLVICTILVMIVLYYLINMSFKNFDKQANSI
ncbi:MraY family glycosyltransferase [Aureibaculum conchae]|uniref:MraY family glycosyltransferase n=1 Tax=Aureibaculum sp. 2308TA14-22 TaxID=3108392 RepID=UPI003390D036